MNRWLKFLLEAEAFSILALGMFGPIYAVFVEQIGGDLLAAGGAYAAFSASAGILIYLIGRWEDHVKHQEKLVVVGYFIMSLGFLGYLLISSPIHLFVVQIILGVGQAINTPAYYGVYTRHLDRGRRTSECGLLDANQYIFAAIAAVLGGAVATLYGFRMVFMIMLLFSIFAGFLSVKLIYLNKPTKKL